MVLLLMNSKQLWQRPTFPDQFKTIIKLKNGVTGNSKEKSTFEGEDLVPVKCV